MLRRAPLVALLVVALVLPRSAAALDFKVRGESLRLDITESMWLAWHADNGNSYFDPQKMSVQGSVTDDNYGELLNRLNLQLAWRRLLVAARFDSGFWWNAPPQDKLDAEKDGRDRFVSPGRIAERGSSAAGLIRAQVPVGAAAFYLEKLSVSYIGRDVEATLGDFYVNLGRGLVLSIRKIDELGTDTTLTGGKLLLHKRDVTATVVAGFTNVQNFDQTRAQWIHESNDFVSAASIGYRIAKRASLVANVMFGLPGCPSNLPKCSIANESEYVLRPGLVLDAPRLTERVGLYVEYARRQDGSRTAVPGIASDGGPDIAPFPHANKEGNALYAAADILLGAATLQLEGKWYDNYQPWHATWDPFSQLLYMVPPTLERTLVQINNNTDILAGRAKLGARFGQDVSAYVSGQIAKSRPTESATDTLVDLVAGAQVRWNGGRSHFFPLVEYRNEHQESNAPAQVEPKVEERLVALEWDFVQHLPQQLSLESSGLIWYRQKPLESLSLAPGGGIDATLDDNSWVEGQVYLKLAWRSKLAFAVGYEFTSAPTEVHNTHDFVNAQVRWNITSGTSLALTGGGYRGGLKCVSGICRVFPPFQGAMLEVVVRL